MKLVVPPNPEGLPYLDIGFVKGHRQIRWLTREEKDSLDPRARDAHFDLTTNTWRIRTEKKVEKGPPKPFPFGPARWEMVVLILFAAPEYVYLPSEKHVYATLARIQKAFGKPSKKKSDFWFETNRKPSYRVRLNPERSYRIVTNSNLDGLPRDVLDTQRNTVGSTSPGALSSK